MVMKVLDRKLLRDLRIAKGQAIAVSMVIVCGVASFVAVLSAYWNLRLTRDAYYESCRFADFWVPLEKAPLTVVRKVAAIPGVTRAQGRIVQDVNLEVEGKPEPCTGRIISLPQRQGTAINDVHMISGRHFSEGVRNEVILSDRFARENRLAVGDQVLATVNDKKQPLRIIGTALSPEYVYMIRSGREFLPNPDRFAILWLKQDFAEMVLGYQEACNEVTGLLERDADVDAVLDRAEALLDPYGVFTTMRREDQLSHRYLSDEIKGLGVSARIMPAVFLGIAAMILAIMLERIVHRERTQIGVLKAYGYSNFAVAAHYMKHALLLSVVGALVGFVAGQWLGRAMVGMYVEFFEFPILKHRFYPAVLFSSLAISVLSGAVGAAWAVAGAVRTDPALAMRPPAPKVAHRIWLERWPTLWRRVSFSGKMILRNMYRYKVRSGLTVFGVMWATAILLFGRFGGDSMDVMIHYHFEVFQKQDVRVDFYSERGKGALLDAARFPHVHAAEPEFDYPFTLKSGWRTKDVAVMGIVPDGRMLNLRTVDGRRIEVGEDGLVLTEHIAETLHLRPGDSVVMKPLMGRIKRSSTVRVRAVVRQLLGSGAYMNIRALSRLLDEPFALNAVLLRVEEDGEEQLGQHLKDVPGVAAVEFKGDSRRKIEETLAASMAMSNVFMAIFAGVIAFAIIYNSTAISLTERTRELASLRVLGFSLAELRHIVLGENVLLSVVGGAAGLGLGTLLCRWLVTAYETDVYRLPFYISARTFAISGLSIAAFVLIANLASRRRIARLDMVEVLKARE